jgi:hypothetical protein
MRGYQIQQIHSLWHYENNQQYLFRPYIDLFLKIKTEASGYPSHCKTPDEKDDFIRQFMDKEGIQLDKRNIKRNEGLRSLAKMMLNSFW